MSDKTFYVTTPIYYVNGTPLPERRAEGKASRLALYVPVFLACATLFCAAIVTRVASCNWSVTVARSGRPSAENIVYFAVICVITHWKRWSSPITVPHTTTQ